MVKHSKKTDTYILKWNSLVSSPSPVKELLEYIKLSKLADAWYEEYNMTPASKQTEDIRVCGGGSNCLFSRKDESSYYSNDQSQYLYFNIPSGDRKKKSRCWDGWPHSAYGGPCIDDDNQVNLDNTNDWSTWPIENKCSLHSDSLDSSTVTSVEVRDDQYPPMEWTMRPGNLIDDNMKNELGYDPRTTSC